MNLRIHILILIIWSVNLNAQTVLYDDPDGESHTNTDMPITDVTPTVDITNCTSIEFSIDYEFPVGWEGSGNMEYLDECCASCAGDPENSLDPPCLQNMSCTGSVGCWDFMWIQFFIDGDPVIENLIGDSGTTDAESMGTFSYIQCLDGNEEAHIEIVNHNSAASETNIYTNVSIICWEAQPIIEDLDPVCNSDLDLVGDAVDPSVVTSWEWSTDGPATIDDETAQTTFATGPLDGDEFTLTTTDVNDCTAETSVEFESAEFEVSVDGGGVICEGLCTTVDTDFLIDISGGTPLYELSVTVNGIPVPFVPSIDINETIRICADPDIIFPEFDDSSDPAQVTIPSTFFPIDLTLVDIVDADGCVGTILNGDVTYTVEQPPGINEPVPPEYCVAEGDKIDLAVMDDEIGDGEDVLWFEDEDLEDEINNPASYDPSNGTTVWAVVDNGDCFSEAVEVNLNVDLMPEIEILQNPIIGCGTDVFILPDLEDVVDVTNEVNAGYYLDPNGQNGPVFQVVVDDTEEIYIYDASADDCFDEVVIPLELGSLPIIESPLDQIAGCGMIELPEVIGENIDEYEYNLEEDGSGTSYFAGDFINTSDNLTVIYLIAVSEDGCETLEELDIVLASFIEYSVIIDPLLCDSLVLPTITPATGAEAYFTGSMGSGTQLVPGDVLYAPFSDTLFIFDPMLDPMCSSEDSLMVSISDGSNPVLPRDTTVCEFIVLPEFGGMTGPNIRYAPFPVTDPNSSFYPGDTLDYSQRLYILDTIGNCIYYDSMDVNIVVEPFAGMDTTLIVCEGFDTGSFDLMELISNPDGDGQWSYPNIADFESGDSTSIMLDVLIPGNYNFQYIIEDSLCGAYLSSVDIEIVSTAYGGENNNLDICSGGQPVDFMQLISFPDTGGEWSQISGPQSLIFNDSTSVDLSGLENGNYVFLYVIEGEAPTDYCELESASLFLNISSGANAGEDKSLTACIGETIDLSEYLSMDADSEGTFEADNIIFNGTTWNTGAAISGLDYIIHYIVESGDPVCQPDTALITVNLVNQLSAGVPISDNTSCEGELIDLTDYLENESAGGIFVYTDNPEEEIIDGLWTASQDTSFLYIVGTESNCPADTLEFEIEVIEEGLFDLEITALLLCQGAAQEALNFILYNLSNTEIKYELSFLDENANLIFQIDTVSYEDIEFFVGIGQEGNSVSNDTVFLEFLEGVNIYDLSIEAFTGNRQCQSSFISVSSISMADTYSETIEAVLCEGESFNFMGFDYLQSTSLTIPGDNITACDSIFILDITNVPQTPGSFTGIFCQGDTIEVLGQNFTEDFQGMENFPQQGIFSCDSLIEIDIVFESSIVENINQQLCEDEAIVINNTTYDVNNTSGTEVLQSASGCDSIINIELQFLEFGEAFLEPSLCPGEIFSVGSDSYNETNNSGISILSNASSNGCDSIVNVSIEYMNNPEVLIQNDICPDEIIMVGNDSYSAQMLSGTTILEGAASNGCDSILLVDLSLIENTSFELVDNICPGQSIIVGSDTYDENNLTGTSLLENASVNGCDSIVNVNLQLSMPMAEISSTILCPGNSESTAQITELAGINLPVEVFINNNAAGTYNSLPIQLSLGAGVSDVLIQGLNGCQYEESLLVEELQLGTLNISSAQTSTNSYQLEIQSDFAYDLINWSSTSGVLSCLTCETNSIIISEDTDVILSVITPEGCELIRSISLTYEEIIQTEAYFIPNIIDLNDPENRSFSLFTDGSIIVREMRIFDRWGNLIFEEDSNSGSNLAWDGRRNDRLVEQGVYIYNITISNQLGEQEILVGNLTLIR